MNFTETLLAWYSKNKRNLPWRSTRDPYKIWLSEIILQQTRVEQGMPYYYRFTERYPDLKLLAVADEKEVLRLWQGLGYYSRARNLLFASRQMMELYGGFAKSYDELIKLKGIGDYTASAISSIAFDEPHAVVDGNVYRFLARHFGVETPIDSVEGKKVFKTLAQQLLDTRQPGIFNQAVMEFGALQCKPVNPLCDTCPFNQTCFARMNEYTKQLPVKEKITKVRTRYFHYLVLHHHDQLFIRQRKEKDIWQGLFELPLIETPRKQSVKLLMKGEHFTGIVPSPNSKLIYESEVISHQLSHQLLITRFYHFEVGKVQVRFIKKHYEQVSVDELKQYAFPQLIVKYFKSKNWMNTIEKRIKI